MNEECLVVCGSMLYLQKKLNKEQRHTVVSDTAAQYGTGKHFRLSSARLHQIQKKDYNF